MCKSGGVEITIASGFSLKASVMSEYVLILYFSLVSLHRSSLRSNPIISF